MPGTQRNPQRSTLTDRVDLHTHTTASDGTLTPEALLEKARLRGVTVLAISDHDTLDGYRAARACLASNPFLRLIPAIEMSAEGAEACHLLGYFIDPENADFERYLQECRRRRVERLQAMVQRLSGLGVSLTWDEVVAQAKGTSVGRPHIADALIARRLVARRQEAFDRYLKRGGPAYVETDSPTAEEVIARIGAAGGIASLAHPVYDISEAQIQRLADLGLGGLESYYPDHGRALTERFVDLARRFHLVPTGGSDFHGPRTNRSRLACVQVPAQAIDCLEEAVARRRQI